MRVPKGCPVCQEDVLGTSETGYFCRRCNVIFRRKHIVFRYAREEVLGVIEEHFGEYGKKPEKPRLKAAEHGAELRGTLRHTGSSFEELRRSVEEAKRMIERAENGNATAERILESPPVIDVKASPWREEKAAAAIVEKAPVKKAVKSVVKKMVRKPQPLVRTAARKAKGAKPRTKAPRTRPKRMKRTAPKTRAAVKKAASRRRAKPKRRLDDLV